jgi:murein DD-endopeptidase MepM/ murein hydrolase activator NlpD
MKKNLIEQLERMHRLNYGKKVVNEGELWDKIISGLGIKTDKHDDKKADAITPDVDAFFKNLETAASGNGITQQERGSYQFQKEVESMQIGLILLGYELPRYGVDGLFGPETGAAVAKFTEEKVKKPINEATTIVPNGDNKIIGVPGQGTHKQNDWQSGNAWDVTGPVGSEVKSITSGKVTKVYKSSGIKKTGGKIIYGDQVTVKSDNGPDVFYTHIDSVVKPGDTVSVGTTMGTIVSMGGIEGHVHVGLSSGNIKDLADVKGNGGGGSAGGTNTADLKVATPEMLKTLIELLKARGVKSEELSAYINKANGSGGNITVNDWDGIVNLVIDKLEGGYYHPDMLNDGRVKDGRYGDSGETMFGIDRLRGPESKTPKGQEFWALIDAEGARSNWKHEYMLRDNPTLNGKLRKLVAEMMKPFFIKFSKSYLSPEAADIISKDPALTFNFAYATWNGEGWFQRFAKVVNEAVASGNKDPKSLLQIALDRRTGSGNSLMAQGGSKVAQIANSISSSSMA